MPYTQYANFLQDYFGGLNPDHVRAVFDARLQALDNGPIVNAVVASSEKAPQDDDVKKLANNFLVGCDPEFVVAEKADKVYNVISAGIPHEGEVGYDHNGLVVEVRPKPTMGTYALVKRIKQIIKENPALALVADKKWRAGACFKTKLDAEGLDPLVNRRVRERTLTLGGHIHFDIAPPPNYDDADHVRRMKALDRGTRYLEKLDILPFAESVLRRQLGARATNADVKYGQFGDWRPAQGGSHGNRHIEYRTMASWLFDPKVAYTAMTLSKLIAVSPQLALDTLKVSNISFENLKAFFELYRHKDDNACRELENLLDGKTIKGIQADPDSDFKKNWKELSF
jgi:hypothetical protein